MRSDRSLVICTLPRSGSYMLCDGLTQTDRLGYAAEYYSAAHRSYYERLIGDKARSYDVVFDYAMRIGTTPNGVFAVKVLFHQLVTLRHNFDRSNSFSGLPPLQLLDRLLPSPRYLHLVRDDKLRQAISYHRAIASGIWWRFDRAPETGEALTPQYDHAAIAHWLHTMTLWEAAWTELLGQVRGPVLTLRYDDVVRDYAAAMAQVHDLVGIPWGPELAAIRPALKRQSDATTEAWARRFAEETAASTTRHAALAPA